MKAVSNLLFLSNELATAHWQRGLNVPLTFVSFALCEGKMYRHFRNKSTFLTSLDGRRTYGNSVVYGGLFLLQDFDFYIRLLDAYHICSKSTLRKNHSQDVEHRRLLPITPIRFATLEELARLNYHESDNVEAHVYLANLTNPKITKRIHSTYSYRVISGINKNAFTTLYREVQT